MRKYGDYYGHSLWRETSQRADYKKALFERGLYFRPYASLRLEFMYALLIKAGGRAMSANNSWRE